MAQQTLQVPIPRSSLTPDLFSLDTDGNLKIDKAKLNTIVKENINKTVDMNDAVKVGVVISI